MLVPLLMNMDMLSGGSTPPAGQTPRASRYRLGHRVAWVHTVLALAVRFFCR